MSEKAVDSAETNETTVDSEQTMSPEEIMAENERLRKEASELLEKNNYLSGEINNWKSEAKKAFEARDKVKSMLKKEQPTTTLSDEDFQKHLRSLENKLNEKEKELNSFKANIEKEKKISAVKSMAEEFGLKEIYRPRLDKFLDLDEIDLEKPFSIKYQLDAMKEAYPDFFGSTSKDLSEAIPVPKLHHGHGVVSVESLKKEYDEELKKGSKKADVQKLLALREQIEKYNA